MRTGAISLALLACGCASYPKERGERLEQRLDRIETGSDAGQLEAERAGARKQIQQLEQRVSEMQKRLDTLAATPQQGAAQSAEAATRQRGLSDELAQQRAALEEQGRRVATLEKTLAQLQPSAQPAQKRSARAPAPSPRAAPEPPPRPGPEAPARTTGEVPPDKASYLTFAREQEAKGQKAVARDLYEQYVTSFPEDPGAAEAHFRLGEMAFAERRYGDAVGEYGKVAQRFPRSGRAPDALLRTADSMIQMGLKDEAATVLQEIPKRYPATPAASRASKRLSELGEPTRSR